MVRKPAPQPLSLGAEATLSSSAATSPAAAEPSRGPPSSAGAATLNSPDSAPHTASDRPSPRTFTGENTLQVISPSSTTKSPKSPRSPFSKFNPSRRPQTQQGEPPSQSAEVREPLPLRAVDDTHLVQPQTQHPNQNPRDPPATHSIKQSATSPNLPYANDQQTTHEEKHTRNSSRFFNFGKQSKSNLQLQNHNHTASSGEAVARAANNSTMAERVPSKSSKNSDLSVELPIQKPTAVQPSRSDVSLPSTNETDASYKKNKPKPFTLLGRNRSFKEKDEQQNANEPAIVKMPEPERAQTFNGQPPLKTAPLHPEAHDRAFRRMMNSSTRNHSADRAVRDVPPNKEYRNDKENRSHPSSIKDGGGGSTFFGGLKNSGSRAADMISKGLFGKSGRSASTNEREPVVDDEHYVLKVINLPLVEQTRKTRISKRLEDSKDKTEFWMPAFPWRAIDYLNFNGTDVEGLYRVPGSGPQIKKWQRRFDEEHDVDLFAQDDLYDINIIGSMLKAWLRELPDELFPKEAQDRISRECSGTEEVPKLLIEELSNLPPFNYYLLFAITCHLSLLLAHSDKNKMDFRNLCICFQPCMKIDAFCFKFLVCNWRSCWQGCKNESKYIEEEYQLFQQPLPKGLTTDHRPRHGTELRDERNVSSSESNQDRPTKAEDSQSRSTPAPSQPRDELPQDYSAHLLNHGSREATSERPVLPALSPMQPLSPLGF
ncbi:hypothetical protein F5Y16DRAFT_5336 [Xylariaceae sp. FL0255]|nr:hypothetical protein F5Y16DRAFT_5336 [Xylariaceae sp. FL0255]